jgi:curved DNA binding protein
MSEHGAEDSISDLSSPEVTTKYMTAASIANAALTHVLNQVIPGADISALCRSGDAFIEAECAKVYNKKSKNGDKVFKGIAFPTCISPNNLHDHYSPLPDESRTLVVGDVVKVDLAVHIDGFLAAVAHTVVAHATSDAVVITDKRAKVIQAAYHAAQAALRKIKVGGKSTEVSAVIDQVAAEYAVKPFKGIHSYEYKQDAFDQGNAFVSGFGALPGSVDPLAAAALATGGFQFELNTVYGVDVIFTTGNGQPKETELRTTVYKRSPENFYVPKTQAGRDFLAAVGKEYPTLAFSLNDLVKEGGAASVKAGAAEAKRHRLIEEFPVLRDMEGEIVAQFKFTVLLLPGGVKKVTGFELSNDIKAEVEIKNEELKALLASSANPKKLKKKAATA